MRSLWDRWNRRRVMPATALASAALMLSVPLAAWADRLQFAHVLAVAAGVAGLYVVVAALTVRLRWNGSEDRRSPDRRTTLRTDIAEGLRFIWQHPVVRWFTVLGAGASLAGGASTGLLVVVGVEQLGLTDDDARLGWLYAAGAVGTLVASLVLPRLQRGVGVGRITVVGYTVVGYTVALVALLGFSLTWSLPVALVLHGVLNSALTLLIVNGIVTRQVITPDRLRSRVDTTARLIAWGGNPLGAGAAGFLAEAVGTGWALRLAAPGLVVSLVGGLVVGMLRYLPLADLTGSPVGVGPGRSPCR